MSTATATFSIMVMMLMIMVMSAATFSIMMMLMIVVMSAATLTLVMMFVTMMIVTTYRADHFFLFPSMFHRFQNLISPQFLDWGSDDHRIFIHFADHFHCTLHFFLCCLRCICTAENNGSCILQLIFKELSKVSHIHLTFVHIYHGSITIQADLTVHIHILHRFDHIRQFSHTRRLDHDPIRMIGSDHFFQRSSKIPHQRTADTARIHLPDLNTRLLQKTSVNTDLSKFIFNQHYLLPLQSLRQQLFDQCSFACSQKT